MKTLGRKILELMEECEVNGNAKFGYKLSEELKNRTTKDYNWIADRLIEKLDIKECFMGEGEKYPDTMSQQECIRDILQCAEEDNL